MSDRALAVRGDPAEGEDAAYDRPGRTGTEPAGSAAAVVDASLSSGQRGQGGPRAWLVWGVAIGVYVLAVFHRTSLGVAGLVAAERFGISATQLATLTMLQLGVYAALQIPVGALVDRIGPRGMLLIGVVLMSAAQLGFALAATFPTAVAARVLVGAGDAMVFISVLRLAAFWFPPARLPMLTQATGLMGQVGALLAAAPLTAMLSGLGWARAFGLAASLGVVAGLFLVFVVRDTPSGRVARQPVRMDALAAGLRGAWSAPGTRLGLWTHFTTQFGATVFAMLWGFPFLVAGEGLSPEAASGLLMLLTVVTVLSAPVVGAIGGRWPYSRSTLVLGIVGAIMAVWAVVLIWPGPAPLWLLVLLVSVLAVGGPGSMVGFDLARTFNPPGRLGSASGIVNVGGFTASLSAVLLIGIVVDLRAPGGPATYTLDTFRVALAVQFLVWTLGAVQIARYRRRTRQQLRDEQPDLYAELRRLPQAR